MHYRRFGKTNLNLSVFSLGTMRYLVSEENAVQTIRQAVDMGINHIETARGYGKSEKYLGSALVSGLERAKLYITTKITPTKDVNAIESCIDESLENLNIDYLDCLAIHGINTWEHLEITHHSIRAFQKLIDDGRVKNIGFSTHAPLEVILAAINTDFFQFINLHYYYFFQRHAPAVELAHQKDMGIFIISPADKGGQLYTPPPTLQELCQPFSPLELNYRFLLSDPRITTLSVGAARPQELEWPLTMSDRTQPLTSQETEIFQRLETEALQRLGTDKCSQCYACLPCPEDINIPEVLRLRNLGIAYDMTSFGKYRYGMFENAGHWFPGKKGNRCTECGECLPRCPEKLDIPSLLKDTHQRFKGTSGRRLWD
ncbi:aldo/keto reductase [Dapis sp. BLCC M172]|uniref:aldo/keto reductase n=1 Tax=Dapis sp. BLCC M172 TaxID=2975281 RepID=UPI003CF2D059